LVLGLLDGSFEQITLHPQARIVGLQLAQPGPLVAGQSVLLATVGALLADPVPRVESSMPSSRAISAIGRPEARTRPTASRLTSE
jgi:hypothetical protein